jgi:NAD-dependent protein deacetylase sirtuin 6
LKMAQFINEDDDLTEYMDEQSKVDADGKRLAQLLVAAKGRAVVYTGAGISASASIPTYRGPEGAWVLLAQGKVPKSDVDLAKCEPTFAHMALAELCALGLIECVVSTNLDGLHVRSGIEMAKLAELHGNIYAERCTQCEAVHLRPFDVRPRGVQFVQARRATGRLCERKIGDDQCRGELRDTMVNFSESLPRAELAHAERCSSDALVTLVLGSSMVVSPACELPSLSYDGANGGATFSICNLQKTRYDDACARADGVRSFAPCDELMRAILKHLPEQPQVPAYDVERDPLHALSVDELIVDPNAKKYNCHSMSEDGPPPDAVLDAIRSGFRFHRRVNADEKIGIPVGKVL